jgi:hypothetical protein
LKIENCLPAAWGRRRAIEVRFGVRDLFSSDRKILCVVESFGYGRNDSCGAKGGAYGLRPMRVSWLILGFLLLPSGLWAADWRTGMLREAGKYVQAWQRSDPRTIVAYLPARVVQQCGGRDAVLRELADEIAQARKLGATELEATLGSPSALRQLGPWMASVLPVTALLRSTHLELTQKTHVLVLSSDRGKRWWFVLLYGVTQAELNAWFPEFHGRILVPSTPAPTMKIVYE